jgi:methyl-accepting chemotaxis protein
VVKPTFTHVLAALALVALLALGASLSVALAQEEAPRVVKFEVDKTTVYRGYQTIEVRAYILTSTRPQVEAVATLNAGITVKADLGVVRLSAPTEVQVGNKTYSVRYIAIGRLFVPESAAVGKAILEVKVNGTAGDQTIYNETTFEITILNHIPVEAARFSSYLALSRAQALLQAAQALGVDVGAEAEKVSEVAQQLATADDALFVRGEVEEALSTYEAASSELDALSSAIVAKLSTVAGQLSSLATDMASIDSRVASLEESVSTLASAFESFSAETRDALSSLTDALSGYAQALQQFSDATSSTLTTLSSQLSSLSNSVETLSSNTNKAISSLSEAVSSLSSKVDTLYESQKGFADAIGSLQTAMMVIAVVLIVMAIATIFSLRRVAAKP